MNAAAYRPCVGIMLTNATGQVFVGQRIDSPGPAWQMPQGGIDPGETPHEAALRELWEETGVQEAHVEILRESDDWLRYELPEQLAAKMWGGRFAGQEQKWFLLRLNAPDSVINIATENPEFSSWKWLEPRSLPEVIVPFKRALYNDLVTIFEEDLRQMAQG